MHRHLRTLTALSGLALSVNISSAVAERAAERERPPRHWQPVPGCVGCEVATVERLLATPCEEHREFFARVDAELAAARERLDPPQPLRIAPPMPAAPHGPNRAQRRAAMFARGRRV